MALHLLRNYLKKSHYLRTKRDFSGESIPIEEILDNFPGDDVTDVFWKLVASKDPLIIALAQINARHSMSNKFFNDFAREAIVAFRHDEVVGAVKKRLAGIRKSIGKTAIANE